MGQKSELQIKNSNKILVVYFISTQDIRLVQFGVNFKLSRNTLLDC
jgi:hypothetical protein